MYFNPDSYLDYLIEIDRYKERYPEPAFDGNVRFVGFDDGITESIFVNIAEYGKRMLNLYRELQDSTTD